MKKNKSFIKLSVSHWPRGYRGRFKVFPGNTGRRHAMSEDVLAVRVEHIGQQGRRKRMIMIVVYMTVEGERAGRENSILGDP